MDPTEHCLLQQTQKSKSISTIVPINKNAVPAKTHERHEITKAAMGDVKTHDMLKCKPLEELKAIPASQGQSMVNCDVKKIGKPLLILEKENNVSKKSKVVVLQPINKGNIKVDGKSIQTGNNVCGTKVITTTGIKSDMTVNTESLKQITPKPINVINKLNETESPVSSELIGLKTSDLDSKSANVGFIKKRHVPNIVRRSSIALTPIKVNSGQKKEKTAKESEQIILQATRTIKNSDALKHSDDSQLQTKNVVNTITEKNNTIKLQLKKVNMKTQSLKHNIVKAIPWDRKFDSILKRIPNINIDSLPLGKNRIKVPMLCKIDRTNLTKNGCGDIDIESQVSNILALTVSKLAEHSKAVDCGEASNIIEVSDDSQDYQTRYPKRDVSESNVDEVSEVDTIEANTVRDNTEDSEISNVGKISHDSHFGDDSEVVTETFTDPEAVKVSEGRNDVVFLEQNVDNELGINTLIEEEVVISNSNVVQDCEIVNSNATNSEFVKVFESNKNEPFRNKNIILVVDNNEQSIQELNVNDSEFAKYSEIVSTAATHFKEMNASEDRNVSSRDQKVIFQVEEVQNSNTLIRNEIIDDFNVSEDCEVIDEAATNFEIVKSFENEKNVLLRTINYTSTDNDVQDNETMNEEEMIIQDSNVGQDCEVVTETCTNLEAEKAFERKNVSFKDQNGILMVDKEQDQQGIPGATGDKNITKNSLSAVKTYSKNPDVNKPRKLNPVRCYNAKPSLPGVNKPPRVLNYSISTPDPALGPGIYKPPSTVYSGLSSLRIQTKLTHLTPPTAVPIFTGPVDRWFMFQTDFAKLIETVKSKPSPLQEIDIGEKKQPSYDGMKQTIINLSEKNDQLNKQLSNQIKINKDLEKEIKILQKCMTMHKKKLAYIRKTRKMTKEKAYEMLTKNMSEDTKMILNMQLGSKKNKATGRRYDLKEKLFALALYKLSKLAYNYLGNLLTLPKAATVEKFWKRLHKELLIKDGKKPEEDGDKTNNVDEELTAAVESIAAVKECGNQHENTANTETQNESNLQDNTQTYYPYQMNTDDYFQSDCNNEIVISTDYQSDVDFEAATTNINQAPSNIQLPQNAYPVNILSNTLINNILQNANIKVEHIPKPKIQLPYMTEEKTKKIDYILSKMMSPDDLKKLLPRKKYKKKKKPKTDNTQKEGTAPIKKRAPRVRRKPKLQPQLLQPNIAQNTVPQLQLPYMGFMNSQPPRANSRIQIISNENVTPKTQIIKTKPKGRTEGLTLGEEHKETYFQPSMYVLGTRDIRIAPNDANTHNIPLSQMNAGFSYEHRTPILHTERNTADKSTHDSVKRKTKSIKHQAVKRKKKLALDQSSIIEDTPRSSYRPGMYIDHDRVHSTHDASVSPLIEKKRSKVEKILSNETNNKPYEVNETVSRGFDMPNLSEVDSPPDSSRRYFGTKRLPINPYRTDCFQKFSSE